MAQAPERIVSEKEQYKQTKTRCIESIYFFGTSFHRTDVYSMDT